MTRKDALLRLHQRLVGKRDALRKKLYDDLESSPNSRETVGDVGDLANDGTSTEIDSQLASLESRELKQTERAIQMIREGRYGLCENCERPIPIARLKALPFTSCCVQCQRVLETYGARSDDSDIDWETAYEFEGHLNDRELTIGELEFRNLD